MNVKEMYIKYAINTTSEYGKKYIDLVSKSDTGLFKHVHHIVPVAYFKNVLGDTNARARGARASHKSNIVSLTVGHHLLAHFYLMKSAKGCIAGQMKRAFRFLYDATSVDDITEADVLTRMQELDNAYYETIKHVGQWSKDGKFIALHSSIKEAALSVNAWPAEISSACRGEQPTSHGYVWVFEGTDPKSIHFPDIDGDNINRHRVAQYTTGGSLIAIYDTLTDAANAVGCCSGSITQQLKGKSAVCKGFVFADADTPIEEITFPGDDYISPVGEVQVCQYDTQGNLIHIYESIAAAAKALNVKPCGIITACKELWRIAYGFYWRKHIDGVDESHIDIVKHEHKEIDYKRVYQYDFDGNFIHQYDKADDAAKAVGCTPSLIWRCCNGKGISANGYVWSYDAPDVISMVFPGSSYTPPTTKRRKVAQYDMNGKFIREYDCVGDAARDLQKKPCGIIRCCGGHSPSAYGYRWSYDTHVKQLSPLVKKMPKPSSLSKSVIQYDKSGNILAEYQNLHAAARALNVSVSSISLACSGKHRIVHGFIWAYSTTSKSDIVFPGNTYQHGCKRQVCQLTLNGKIIATHESISRGAKSVGIRPGAISKVLRGEQKLAGGFKWAYADAA